MKKFYILLPLVIVVLLNVNSVNAQSDKITYNGLGRSVIQNDRLNAGGDTLHGNKSNSGYTLVDEAINIKPNSTTEIQAIVRFRNEYGGFYGNGAGVTFRQLYIKGKYNDNIRYQFGDLNLSLTKFTLFNSNADGAINEATTFKMLTDINYYENFNSGNTWRQQGVQSDWLIPVENKKFNSIFVNGFLTRNRATNLSFPEMLFGGGSVTIKQSDYFKIGGNYVNLFSLSKTANNSKAFFNPVITTDFKINGNDSVNFNWYFKGETGMSQLKVENPTGLAGSKNDFFYELSLGGKLNSQGLLFELTYRDVGPQFYSAGAQSKRINFNATPGLFSDVTNLNLLRTPTVFDITRDKTIYNQVISTQLMSYDMTLSNVLPYGVATPNRTGLNANVGYSDTLEIFNAGLDVSLLKEIRGEGTDKLRNFMLVRAKADFFLNKLINWEKVTKLTFGLQLENTRRDDDTHTIGKVNFSSNIIDAGLDIECLKNFDLLLGAKVLAGSGNEYGKVYNALNEITDYSKIDNFKQQQQLLAVGAKYRFSPNIYLTLQGQKFNYNTAMSGANYDFLQIFVLFNMKF